MRATLTIDDEPSTRAEVVTCIRDLAARPGALRLDPDGTTCGCSRGYAKTRRDAATR